MIVSFTTVTVVMLFIVKGSQNMNNLFCLIFKIQNTPPPPPPPLTTTKQKTTTSNKKKVKSTRNFQKERRTKHLKPT